MGFRFCSLSSGSSGNSQYIESDEAKILVDAGLSGIKIQRLLGDIEVNPETIDGILITHEHSDHIKGIGILSRRFDIPIYANQKTWYAIGNSLGKIQEYNKKVFVTGERFEIKDIDILPFGIYHDAIEPVGYTFEKNDKKISLLTDTGMVCENIKQTIKGSNLTLIESNHDIERLKTGRYPWHLKRRILSENGHLSNVDCGNLITTIHTMEQKAIYLLAHLSEENNTPEIAYNTVKEIIIDNGFQDDITLEMTFREKTSKVYDIS